MYISQIVNIQNHEEEFQLWARNFLREEYQSEVFRVFLAAIEFSNRPKTTREDLSVFVVQQLASTGLQEAEKKRTTEVICAIAERFFGSFRGYTGDSGTLDILTHIMAKLSLVDRNVFKLVNTEARDTGRTFEIERRAEFLNTPELRELLVWFGFSIPSCDPKSFKEWEKKIYSDLSFVDTIGEYRKYPFPCRLDMVPNSRIDFYPGETLVRCLKSLKKTFSDITVVTELIHHNPYLLKWASPTLKANRALVLETVTQDGCVLKYANEVLRNDREIVLQAVRRNGFVFSDAGEILRNDRAFVLSIVKISGAALDGLSEMLRNDREIALEAINQTGYSYRFVGDKLRNDREIILAAVRKNGRVLELMSPEIRNDRTIVLEAVRQTGDALNFAGEIPRSCRDIVFQTLQQVDSAFRNSDEEIQNDWVAVRDNLKQKRFLLGLASQELQQDPQLRQLAGFFG